MYALTYIDFCNDFCICQTPWDAKICAIKRTTELAPELSYEIKKKKIDFWDILGQGKIFQNVSKDLLLRWIFCCDSVPLLLICSVGSMETLWRTLNKVILLLISSDSRYFPLILVLVFRYTGEGVSVRLIVQVVNFLCIEQPVISIDSLSCRLVMKFSRERSGLFKTCNWVNTDVSVSIVRISSRKVGSQIS